MRQVSGCWDSWPGFVFRPIKYHAAFLPVEELSRAWYDFLAFCCIPFWYKYGIKKFKYSYMIPYIVVSWLVALGFSVIPYLPGFIANNAISMIGLCTSNTRFFLFRTVSPVILVLYFLCLCVTITFSVLSYLFFKRNTIEGGNADVKKAVAKTLIYFLVVAIVAFVSTVLPLVYSRIRLSLLGQSVLSIVLFNWFGAVLFSLPTLTTPIMTIILLNPVKRALKEIVGKFCSCCGSCRTGGVNETERTRGTELKTEGTRGTEGTIGADETEGTRGTEGTIGADETEGTRGTEGTIGADVTERTRGTEGTRGTEETIGADVTEGTRGTEETIGADVTEGTRGTEGTTETEETIGTNVTEGTRGTEGTRETEETRGTEGTRETEGTQLENEEIKGIKQQN